MELGGVHGFWECSVNSCSVFGRTHIGSAETVALDNVLKGGKQTPADSLQPSSSGDSWGPSDTNGNPWEYLSGLEDPGGTPTVAFYAWIIRESYHVLSTCSVPVPTPRAVPMSHPVAITTSPQA